jgi:hypothetical protein
MFLRVPLCIIIALFTFNFAGCASLKSSVSPNFHDYVNELPFQSQTPIARELRYVVAHTLEVDGELKNPVLTSNIPDMRNRRSVAYVATTQTSKSGTRWSEIYAEKAQAARAAGNSSDAQFFSQLSISNRKVEIAMNDMINGVNGVFSTFNAVASAISVYTQASMDATGRAIYDWTINHTGSIGDEAPEHSVLYLDIKYVNHGESFELSSMSDFVVRATLIDGKGNIIRSNRAIQVYTNSGNPDKTPAEFVPMKGSFDENKKVHVRELLDHAWGTYHGILINAAIADLYRRMEVLR